MIGGEGQEVRRTTKDITIDIGRIQTAIAEAPHSAKFIIKTPTGSREIQKRIVSKIIDLAYIERIRITTDRLLIEKVGRRIIVQKLDPGQKSI